MAKIFPTDFEEKLTIAQDDYILFSDSEDNNKIKKAQYSNLKGEQGDPWTAATITVGTVSTWAAWSSATVTNSWTSTAAVLDFSIPQWIAWTDWAAATITAWTTSTLSPWSSATVTNSGTSSAAVFNFGIPRWNTWNWIASITSSKVGKTTTVTITETDGDSDSFQIQDWADGQWSGDVVWPASSTDGHLAVFDGGTWKIIKDWWAIPTTTVVDALDSTSTTSALSANQGRVLDGKISDLSWLWKFLSLWDCTTWQPISFPLSTPYSYTTWDYFLVETVSSATPPVNYKPNGSSYTWTASSTTESDEVEVWDVYIYDGSSWLLQSNHWKTVTFANIAGSPSDNTALANDLADKQDALTLPATPTSWHLVTWGADNETLADGWAIPVSATTKQFAYPSVSDDITSLHTWLFQWNTPTRKWVILTTWWGNYTTYYTVTYSVRDTFSDAWIIYAETTDNSGTTYVKIDYEMPSSTATVTAITTSTGSFFAPSNAWSTGNVLTKTAAGYEWAAPSGWDVMVSSQANNILTSWMKIWAWTQSNYESLWTYDNNTVYLTI